MTQQVTSLRKEISTIDAEVVRIEALLKVADPDNYFRPGTRAAQVPLIFLLLKYPSYDCKLSCFGHSMAGAQQWREQVQRFQPSV